VKRTKGEERGGGGFLDSCKMRISSNIRLKEMNDWHSNKTRARFKCEKSEADLVV
jgi:hypothetical protein